MKFIELHRINTYFYTNGRFDSSRFTILESYQLHSYPFHIIQYIFCKLLQQQFCIRFHQSVRTSFPCLSFCAQVSIIQIIIAIIHQISLERSSHHCFRIFGHISQKNIQCISTTYFRLTLNDRHFWFYGFDRSFRFRSRWTRFSFHVIVIRFYHYALTYRHRNVKAVRIFYQNKIFSLESGYDSATYFTKEAYFISYFHCCIFNLSPN